jgi:protein-S-isoprenylcysteine O-methyltransferase Ste14
MTELEFFNILLISWFALALVIFITLFFLVAPYGRYSRSGWGPALDNRLGWIIMEAASPLVFAVCFILGSNTVTITELVFLSLWEAHYIHRAFIYPFSLSSGDKRMPVAVISLGVLFNTVNAYLNGRYIFTFSAGYANQWLADPRFIVGVGLFLVGFVINRQADRTLRNLRRPGESGYKVPYGGLYRWISCPNYLGEILTWVGWAVATWSLPGLSFAVWTIANLAPRARAHHAWYRAHFSDYPTQRKALVPGVW